MELEDSTCQTSDYTTKLQSSKQYGTGTRKEILKIWAEINAKETKETIAKINKAKS